MKNYTNLSFENLLGDLEDTYLVEFSDQQMYIPKSVVMFVNKKKKTIQVEKWFVKLHHLKVYKYG